MELETLPIGRLSEKDLKIYEAVSATGYSILYDEEFPVLQSAEEFEKMNMSGQENPDTGSTEDPLAMQERRLAAQVSELEKLSRRIVE